MQVGIHGILEAGVVDDGPAAVAERAVGALAWSVIEAWIAAGNAAGRAGQDPTCPVLPVGRAVEAGDADAFFEGTGAGPRHRGPGAGRLLNLIVGAGNQDARDGVPGDRRLVLLVARESEVVVQIDEVVPRNRGPGWWCGQAGGTGLDETEGERGRQHDKGKQALS